MKAETLGLSVIAAGVLDAPAVAGHKLQTPYGYRESLALGGQAQKNKWSKKDH